MLDMTGRWLRHQCRGSPNCPLGVNAMWELPLALSSRNNEQLDALGRHGRMIVTGRVRTLSIFHFRVLRPLFSATWALSLQPDCTRLSWCGSMFMAAPLVFFR